MLFRSQPYQRWLQMQADSDTARLLLQDPDPAVQSMAQEEIAHAIEQCEQLEAQLQRMLLPKDPDDERAAFVEIRAGTGGDESALFAGDLLRMYTRYAEDRGWKIEPMDSSPSELGGMKEVIFMITGDDVYKRLKHESGVHRVQRVPATEAQGQIGRAHV